MHGSTFFNAVWIATRRDSSTGRRSGPRAEEGCILRFGSGSGGWRRWGWTLVAWLGVLSPLAAAPAFDQAKVQTWIEKVRQGELASAREALRKDRDAAFPGMSFSGATCREAPEFALMVAAERQLAARNPDTAEHYLRQLHCLTVARDERLTARERADAIARLGLARVQRVHQCPAPLGQPGLERAARAFEQARFGRAWREWLQAACLLGTEAREVARLRKQLADAPDDDEVHAAAEAPEPVGAAPSPPGIVRPVEPRPAPVAPAPAPAIVRPEPKPAPERGPAAMRSEPDTTALYERIAGQTTPGEIAFNPPQTMRLNRTERIEVRIQPGAVETTGMVGAGEVQVESIRVTSSMSVRLCCGPPAEEHPFDIIAQSSERQVVDAGGFTQWVFEVTPREPGVQRLTLTVAARFEFSNGEVIPKDYPVKIKEIRVEVEPRSNLVPVVAAIAAVLAGLALARWRQTRRRATGTRIFVSYRRDDSGGWVQTLHDRLAARFGDRNVFMDLHDIAPGSDFVTTLDASLKDARVMLVVIGKRWLDASDGAGQRRLDHPEDWVRLEIKAGLASRRQVIPVLVNDATMPAATQLPADIRALARHQAVNLYPDQFAEGVERLIRAIEAGH
ncbi:MAG: TIR domain-containing protein [Thiotrichales bacterium]